MHDNVLLTQYVQDGSEAAFSQIIARHLPLVYGTCRRELGSVTLAEDAAQVVFLLLARKAKTLRAGPSLAGWLYQTSVFVAKDVRKQEARRLRREEAVMQEAVRVQTFPAPRWDTVEPLLHAALSALKPAERDAVLLRFLEGHTLAETGALLGVSEDAARMRVIRALEKMSRYLTAHGAAVTSVALAGLLTSDAARPIPAHAASAITQGILQAVSIGPSTTVLLLSKGVSHTMNILKIKYAVLAASVLLGGASVLPIVHALSPPKAKAHILPALLAQNVTTSLVLSKNQHRLYSVTLPKGTSFFIVDAKHTGGISGNMGFNLSFINRDQGKDAGAFAGAKEPSQLQVMSTLPTQARVDVRSALDAPKSYTLDIYNKGVPCQYWITVLVGKSGADASASEASPVLAVPLFGSIVPTSTTLNEAKSGRLDKSGYAYFLISLKAGRYKSLLQFARVDGKPANVDGDLSLSDEKGVPLFDRQGAPDTHIDHMPLVEDINHLHSSESPDQNTTQFELKQGGTFLMTLSNQNSSPTADDSAPVNFTEQIVPDDAPPPAVKKS